METKSQVARYRYSILMEEQICKERHEMKNLYFYMLALIINSILFKETGMYIILAIWFIDEYVFSALHKHYKQLVIINKEIDRRE